MKLAEDLKKAVLQAAMQGKLTKQLKTDSSVDELLKKIADEKAKLIEEGKIKKEKPLAEITEEEIPFDIPENWRFIKLGSIIDLLSGRDHEPSGYNSKSLGVPYMTGASNISNGELIVNRWTEKPTAVSHLGDLLITCKGTIGEMAYNKIGDIHIARQIMGINTYDGISLDYIQICLKQKVFELNQKAKSMIPGIAREDLLNLIVPLPPIEEQQRIVEKLNQILPLIDEYGKEEDELITLCQKFPEEMKKSVLQSAMQGKLTEQLETDSSVDELLKKIADEKAKLIAEGKIKKEKSLAEIPEEEIPFDIPENWRWEKLGNVIRFINGRAYSANELLTKGKYKVLRVGNFFTNESWYYSDLELPEEKYCYNGDLLYAWSASFGPRIWDGNKTIFHYHIWNVDYNRDAFYRDFLYWYFEWDKNTIKQSTTGSTMVHVSMTNMVQRLIPFPPIEEQQRIVEKLNTILPIIDSMAVYGTKKKAGRPKQEEALAFISSLLGTQKSTDSKSVTPEILELTSKAKEELPAIVKKYADLMCVTYNRITIRHQKTRWGSCTKTGNLSFNCLIMKMPENVRDYVIIHELAHRKELNHNINFWTIVNEYCPWYKNAKLWLKNNGNQLMENENA